MTACAIGIDIGGTKCAAGIVRLSNGQILERERFPTQPQLGGAALLQAVMASVERLTTRAAQNDLKLQAIGLGLAELVAPDQQILSRATIDWTGIDARQQISAKFGLPVSLTADVRAAALAEAHFGAGRSFEPFLYVTVGTGISACLVLQGIPYLGSRGLTGTFASSPQLIPACQTDLFQGQPLEHFSSGPALLARYKLERPTYTGSTPDLIQLAERNEEPARSTVESAGRALGAALAHLVNCLDPAAIVLGGGLGLTEGLYRQACQRALQEFVWSDLHCDLPLRSAELREDAGWIGAALDASRRLEVGFASENSPPTQTS